MTDTRSTPSGDSLTRMHALVELLAERFKGFLPWADELRGQTVRSHEKFIEDTMRKADAICNRCAQSESAASPKDGAVYNPVTQVYFRAGLLACREYMARFVEQGGNTEIAASIRANWWPSLGKDYGPPRKMAWAELTEGEYGTPSFRAKDAVEVSPTLEALPVALQFLQSQKPGS